MLCFSSFLCSIAEQLCVWMKTEWTNARYAVDSHCGADGETIEATSAESVGVQSNRFHYIHIQIQTRDHAGTGIVKLNTNRCVAC